MQRFRTPSLSMLPPPYTPVRLLGRGGEGDSWLARDTVLERDVVCKRVLIEGDPTDGDRPPAILRNLASLSHAGVPTLLDICRHRGAWWLVLEYVPGVSLKAVFDDHRALLGPAQWLDLLIDLTAALGKLHLVGCVHADINPGNVLISADGHAHLIDYGQARRLGETMSCAAADGFLAPEAFEHPVAVPAADAYSLGVLLYWLLGQEPPATGADRGFGAGVWHPLAPTECSDVEEILWATARALTDANPSHRPDLRSLHQSLIKDRRRLPVLGRDNLVNALRSQSDGVVETAEPCSLRSQASLQSRAQVDVSHAHASRASIFSFQSFSLTRGVSPQRRSDRPRLRPLFAVPLLLLTGGLLLGATAGWVESPQEPLPVKLVLESVQMDVRPTTPLPESFQGDWLGVELSELSTKVNTLSGEHRLRLTLSCSEGMCQLVARHKATDVTPHWHQQTIVASTAAGVWRGALLDLLLRCARH